MKATLDVHHRHNLHSTTRLVVNEKFDQLLQPSFAENSKSFLTSSGALHIRTWLDKNAYVPGKEKKEEKEEERREKEKEGEKEGKKRKRKKEKEGRKKWKLIL